MMHLLPPNRSPLEARVAASHPLALPVPLRALYDPATCPVDLLPFLAWAFSVDHWSADWPENVKRRFIAESFAVHRMKGTRTAIDRALAAMGVDVELTEWFETSPNLPRGTFDALLYVNENLTPSAPALIGPELYTELRATIDAAKNVRSHYTFRIGARFGPNTLGVASGMGAGALSDNDARPIYRPVSASSVLSATANATAGALTRRDAAAHYCTPPLHTGFTNVAAARAHAVGRFQAEPSPLAVLDPAQLLAAATCRAVALTYYTMEATA